MAGMFYSLKEVAEKLNKTEEEVKQIVRDGRLREFRDGPNLLFKVDEVEALIPELSSMESEKPSAPVEETEEQEISLTPEPTETEAESELTDADTAIAGEDIGVLGETDSDQQVIDDDTMAETKATSAEASLEEIEEDVSLDSFGSGSGLLDLSLQADDTSLGGILDEIYTPEGEEGQKAAEGSAMEVAAEAEEMLSDEELAAPQPSLQAQAIAQAYVEPEPDTISNALGIMLFLPLLAVIYTAIVAVAGFNNVMPTILAKVQSLIWYIAIGATVVALLIVAMAFMLTSKGGQKSKKPKAKKAKKAKEAPQPAPAPEEESDAG